MTDDLPEPMVPPECDLRGMPFMPLDLVRLFDSDLYAISTGDEFKAAFTLWGKSFLQRPSASLPADDRVLAHLSGAGSTWKKVRDMALHGWVKCSDGRLYHPVVAEKAREAWQSRLALRARTEAARQARLAKRNNEHESVTTDNVTLSVTETATTSVTDNVTTNATQSKGQGQGQGQDREERKKEFSPPPSLASDRRAEPHVPLASLAVRSQDSAEFQQFWQKYPRREGKGAARQAFAKARKSASFDAILAALDRPWPNDPRFVPHPATWLNQQRWLDEIDATDPVLRAAGLDENGNPLRQNGPQPLGVLALSEPLR